MLYISNFCCIGAMGVFRPDSDLSNLETFEKVKEEAVLHAKEPDYRTWIAPMKQRRMSKPIRMAVAAMKMCFETQSPDAIHIGTAFGQLSDSESFLSMMIDLKESTLPPTSFIQSTHNTVSGALALEAQVYGHNVTCVHAGHSFENAFWDAVLIASDLPSGSCQLLGAVDEMIPVAAQAIQSLHCANLDGKMRLSEGCAIFKVTKDCQKDSLVQVLACEKALVTANNQEISNLFLVFLKQQGLTILADDLIAFGNTRKSSVYDSFMHDYFQGNKVLHYKDYCGEYPTSTSFGLAFSTAALCQSAKHDRCFLISNYGLYWHFSFIRKIKGA